MFTQSGNCGLCCFCVVFVLACERLHEHPHIHVGVMKCSIFPSMHSLTMAGHTRRSSRYSILLKISAAISSAVIHCGFVFVFPPVTTWSRIKGTAVDFEVVDVVGDPHTGSPPVAWDVCGVHHATREKTLVRKRNVYRGTGLDWDGSRGTDADDCEWIVEEKDAFGFIGSHVAGGVASQLVKSALLLSFAAYQLRRIFYTSHFFLSMWL
jgi:hypothetical protein